MNTWMRKLSAVAAFGTLLVAGASKVQAADTHYAVVTIRNQTNDPITYDFSWGDRTQRFTVQPGECRWHAWEYDFANENRSPVPRIEFDDDLREGIIHTESYELDAYAAPYRSCNMGMGYSFHAFGLSLELLKD